MAGMKEFLERMDSDAKFALKFSGIRDDNKIIELAKAEGYDLREFYSGVKNLSEDDRDLFMATMQFRKTNH